MSGVSGSSPTHPTDMELMADSPRHDLRRPTAVNRFTTAAQNAMSLGYHSRILPKDLSIYVIYTRLARSLSSHRVYSDYSSQVDAAKRAHGNISTSISYLDRARDAMVPDEASESVCTAGFK